LLYCPSLLCGKEKSLVRANLRVSYYGLIHKHFSSQSMHIGPTDPRRPSHPSVASANLRGPKRSINRRAFIDATQAASAFAGLKAKLIVQESLLASEKALTDQALSGRLQAVRNRRLRKTQLAQVQAQTAAHNIVIELSTASKKQRLHPFLAPLPRWQECQMPST
jgi:hypothetical protein